MSNDVEVLLRRLAGADLRAAVFCAAQCARSVLPLADSRDLQSAVETVEAWARGEASRRDCQEAQEAAYTMAIYYGDLADDLSAADVAYAVFCAVKAALGEGDVPSVAAACARAVGRSKDGESSDHGKVAHHRSVLLALVSEQRWPLAVFDPVLLREAAAELAVAWDAVSGISGEISVPDLVESHDRARRLGLDWSDPVARAVAERATDEDSVRALLGR